MSMENSNNVGVEKAQAQQREREGSESDTIIADGSGTVKHSSSGMTVDTHYAAQLRPSRLTGRGLTFMVSLQLCSRSRLMVGYFCCRYWVYVIRL
jgi:hypothetical protein